MAHSVKKDLTWKQRLLRFILITVGALMMALALNVFFIPANLIDGGVTGIALMFSHKFHDIPLGVFLAILNAPFIWLGYKQIGKTFALSTLYGIVVMAIGTSLFKGIQPLTHEPILDALFGGIILGAGVGLVVRNGGALDGTEIVALQINKKAPFSVGEIVMFANVFILGSAAFVFGWENAMYSMIAYFVAFKVIDIVMEGFSDMKTAMIITDKYEEISESIHNRLGRGVTLLEAQGAYSKESKKVIYTVVSRLEESKLKDIVVMEDKDAFLVISDAADVRGGTKTKKEDIH